MDSIKKGFDKVSLLASGKEPEPKNIFSEIDEQCTLSRTTRMYGFGICFGIGFLFSILSSFFIMRPTKFALLYTFGNIISICSTAFLVGPVNQIKNMLANKRIIATGIYVTSMILTLVAALAIKSVILCLIMLVIQFAAFIWYCASYIPGGQAILAAMCKGVFKIGE